MPSALAFSLGSGDGIAIVLTSWSSEQLSTACVAGVGAPKAEWGSVHIKQLGCGVGWEVSVKVRMEGTPGPFVSVPRRWAVRTRPAQQTEGCLSCPRVARELDGHSGDTAGGHGFQPQVPWYDIGGEAQG